MAKQLNVDVNLNTAKAEAALKNLQQLLTQAIQGAGQGGNGALTKEIVKATQEAAKLKTMLASATDTKTGQLNLSKFNQQLQMNGTNLQHYSKSLMSLGPAGEKAFLGLAKSVVSTQAPVKQANTMLTQLGTTLKNTARWQLSSSMLHAFIGGIQNAFSYARGLNDSLNSIRIVTGQSAEQMDKFAERANKAAKALSTSTLDYTDAALIYYQQGIRDDAEIKARTDATIKMANVTGQSAQKVSEQMTAIWNNFADGSTNLEYFADVITALGANTASSSAEISAGLQKFAAVADTVGLSYEYATSALATVVATTRQSADVVGTALKTLFARIQSLNLGETLEDGTTLGKYSKALSQVGIEIKDQSGELRAMDDILDDMGNKWETLNKDQQVALAQTVAGQRQYTQLVALMDNWDFMKENLKIAYDSEGTLEKQQEIYEESWKAARERVKASMQGLTTDLISDDFFIGFNDAIATAISGLDTFIDSLGGLPGLFGMIGVVATKFFSNQVGQQMDKVVLKLKEMTGIAKLEQQTMQNTMLTTINSLTKQGATGVQRMENEAIVRQIALSGQLLARKESLTQADLNSLQTIVELAAAYDDVAIKAAQAAEKAREQHQALQMSAQSQMRNLGTQIALQNGASNTSALAAGRAMAKDFAQDQMKLEELYTTITKLQQAYNSFMTTGTSKFSANGIKELQTALLSINRQLQEADINIASFSTAYNALNSGSIEKLVAKQQELNNITKEYAEVKNVMKTSTGDARAQALERMIELKQREREITRELAQAESEAGMSLEQVSNAVKQAADSLEGYIQALSFGKEGESERVQSLQRLLEQLRELTIVEDEEAAAAKRSAEAHKRASEMVTSMKASATVTNVGKQMTTALGAVSSLAMGVSSLKSAFEALNNTDLSFGEKLLQVSLSMSMGLSMTLSGLIQIGPAMSAIGKSISGGLLTSIALATGQMEALTAAQVAAGESQIGLIAGLKAMKGGFLSLAGTLALYAGLIAAIAAVIAAVVKVTQEAQEASPEGQLKIANQNVSDMSTALMDAKSAAEELNSAFDKYDSVQDKLKSCTRGTTEWTEALKENNNEVLSLLSKYPELAAIEGGLIKNRDGSLSISNKAREELTKTADRNVETMTLGKLMAEERSAELSQSINNNAKLAGEIASEIRMGRETDWQKIFSSSEITEITKDSLFDLDSNNKFKSLFKGSSIQFKNQNQEAIGRREEGGNAPAWAQAKDATTVATEALVENFDQLSGKYGSELEQSLAQIFDQANIKTNAADWAQLLETSGFRDDLIKNTEAYQAQQKAFETSQIGLMSSKLATEGILENDAKNRNLISTILGKQLDERTKSAVDEDKEAYNRGGVERQRLAEEYVKARGGDINSIEWDGNKFSYSDNEGNVFKDITGSMVASVTGAASALEELAGAASAAAGAMKEIPMTQSGEAIRDFLQNEDFSQTSANGLRELLKGYADKNKNGTVNSDVLADNFIKSMGGIENAQKIAEVLGTSLPDLIGTMTADLLNQKDWLDSAERAASIKAFENRGVDRDRLENYSRAELEARQKYEDSKYSGPVKSLQELQTMAEAAGDAQQYLNRTWEDGTRLSADQAAGIKDIVQNQDLYNMAIDENTGKVKDAQLLQELLGDTINGVGIEALRSQMPLYEQLNSLYDDLNKNASNPNDKDFNARQDSILSEIELLEQEIATYQKLALVQSGALQAYDRIAKGKEYDEANDYTDELEGALGSIYSHMEQDDDGNYKWNTLQRGSHEVQAALEALLPEDILTGTNREGITAEQYLRDMYGNGKVGGRYRDKDGNITKDNVDNFVNDMLGKTSDWGTFSGFLKGREGYTAQQLYENGFADFLGVDEQGAVKQQGTIAEAAKSMHMTESSFISMLSAADKYNTSGQSYFSAFTAEGSDLATQLQFQAEAIKSSAEQVSNAKKELDEANKNDNKEQQVAAQEKYNNALTEQAKQIKAQREQQEKAMEGAAKYKALQNELDTAESETEIQTILDKMQQLKDEYGEGIEINVSLVTDESIVDNLKSQIDEQFGEDGLQSYIENGKNGKLTGYAEQTKFWDNIAQQLSGAENIGQAIQDTFGDAFKGVKFEQLPKTIQNAFDKAGLKETLSTYLEEGLEDVETDDSVLSADSINADELVEGARDAAQQAVDAAQEVADSNPIKFTYESEEGEKGPEKTVSDYTGSKSNDPSKDGFTTGNKGGKGAVQSKGSNPKITVELDTTQAQANLDAFTTSIASIPATIPLSISGNITNVSDHIATLSGLLHSLGGAVPVLTITDNTAEVGGKIQQLKTKALQLNGIKPRITISSNASAVLGTVSSLKTTLSTLPSTKVINVSVNVTGEEQLNGVHAYGTARAYGNAFESGKWGTGMGPTSALVGELGQELVVDPSSGKFYTVGDSGAEFITLPKNAIVFNHRQTEELLKFRKINSRGQAMAEGNAQGLAFAAGTDERIQWEEKLITVIRDEVDMYKEINKQVERLEHSVLNLSRNLDRMTGQKLLDQYTKTIEEMNKLYQKQKKAIDQYKDISNMDKSSLNNLLIQWEEKVEDKDSKAGERKFNTNRASQVQDAFEMMKLYGGLSDSDFTRGADGVVSDWDRVATQVALAQMKQNAEITWNSRIHDETLTEVQRTQYENEYNYIMSMVEQISTALGHAEDSMDKIDEAVEKAQDTLEEMHDKQAEAIVKEFELRKQLQENELKRIELKLARLGDSIFKRAEKLEWMFNADNINDTSKHTQLGDWIIKSHAAMKMAEDAQAAWDRSKANYQDPTGINQEKWRDITQKSFDELVELEQNMIDLRDNMLTYYADTIEAATKEVGKYTDQMDHYVSVLDHMMNLMDLTGRKFDYNAKETIIRGQMHNLSNDLDVQTKMFEELDKNREAAEKHLAEHAAEYSKEAYENEYNNYVLPAIQAAQEAEEKKYEAAEAYLQKLQELYDNAFDRINETWDRLGSDNLGFDYLLKNMDRAKAIQEEYLTTTNKLYETNTLMRKVQKDIDSSSNQLSKEKLLNFNKEIEAAQKGDKLAKSSMEILKARYELLQAEMALEDAKDAKSVVRLQRDNEGNYGYVYTADEDDIDDKEQNFADKQNELYNLVLGYQNDYQEKTKQALQQYKEDFMDLERQRAEGVIKTDEELKQKQDQLRLQYKELFESYDISLSESELWLNQIAAEGVSEAWGNSFETTTENWKNFMDYGTEAHNELSGYLSEIDTTRNEVVKNAKLGLDEVNTKVSELTTKSDTLKDKVRNEVIPAVDAELDSVGKLTEAFDEQYESLDRLIGELDKYINELSYALKVDSGGLDQDAKVPDWSVKMAEALAAGDKDAFYAYSKTRGEVIEAKGGFDLMKHGMNKQDAEDFMLNYAQSHAGASQEEIIKAYTSSYQETQNNTKAIENLTKEVAKSNVAENVDNKVHGKIKYNGVHYADGHTEGERIIEYATGGYTGDWGSSGKLALLHEKELVLNKDDTSNLLEALKIAKENYMQSIQTQRLQSLYEQQMIASTEQFTSAAFQNNTDALQQEVTIHAEFPNVTERNEIAEAFKTLVNEASQFANRY